MKIAVEGCAHGELDKIYLTISALERRNNIKIDLLIICGDFQAVRNHFDMHSMAVPAKYRQMMDFYKYYSGEKKVPVLTLVIGGNHEASNYFQELPYGGWLCENMYYLGFCGVVRVNDVRIMGLSGIYKGQDYLKGRFEVPPYDENQKRSIYHIRNVDIFRLKQLTGKVDIGLSHDWPRGVYNYGNVKELLRWKQFFEKEIADQTLGSRPAQDLLMHVKPTYWFAAHLHCKFAAVIPHQDGSETKFLALDKCLPRRDFLQVLEIGEEIRPGEKAILSYDLEWLAVLKATDHLHSTLERANYMPASESFTPSEEQLAEVVEMFDSNLVVPENFEVSGPVYNPQDRRQMPPVLYPNSQTSQLCARLGIKNPVEIALGRGSSSSGSGLSISSFLQCSNATEEEDSTSLMDVSKFSQPSFISDDDVIADGGGGEDDVISDGEEDDERGQKRKEEEGNGGVSGLFCIDKSPSLSRTLEQDRKRVHLESPALPRMSLPKPMHGGESVSELGESPTLQKSRDSSPIGNVGEEVTVKKEEEVADLVTSSTPVATPTTNKQQGFVMKRRNVSMYSTTDDDS